MKRSNKKIIIILCVIAVIALASLIGVNVYRDQKEKARENEQRQTLHNAIVNGSIALGITDIEIVSIDVVRDDDGAYKCMPIYATSEQFGKLSSEEKVQFFIDLHADADVSIKHYIPFTELLGEEPYGGLRIMSNGHEYMYQYSYRTWELYRDGKKFYEHNPSGYVPGSSNSAQKKCQHCNGTGSVKYYYGSSDLEAFLNGHESSWYGPCTSCNGTGKTK